MEAERKKDLVVVGAGWHGLVAAKTYLEVNPSAEVTVIDDASSVGGVWASDNLYPGLKSNNMLGTYEYSDFPMDTSTYGVKPGDHIPGTVIQQYLTDYAKKFGIFEKILFETKVQSAELVDGGDWRLSIARNNPNDKASTEKTIRTKRLIVATGMTSQPFLPNFQRQESFEAPVFHMRDFPKEAGTLETAKTVTVFGGTKSAWDAVYAYAIKGIKVDWIIRESGHGPTWMSPPYVTPLHKWLEKLVHTRFLTWFSPCIWGYADGYSGIRNFFHGTSIGRFIVDKFWGVLGNDVITLNKFDADPETAKLKPWSSPFFIASGLSILNYPTDFFDLVRNGTVSVHITDIMSLSPKTVHTSDGSRLRSDALVCATGWKHVSPITFLPSDLDVGLPFPIDPSIPITARNPLYARADTEILARFPRLANQPVQNPKYAPLTATPGVSDPDPTHTTAPDAPLSPYQLYRFMVPPSLYDKRSLAFAGAMMSISTPIAAQAQALWITAYFGNQLSTDANSPEDISYTTVLHNRFGKWRYPAGFGARFPDMVFDALPYLDLLLGDLGLNVHRKNGKLSEIFSPYGPEDYKDLVAEWVDRRKKLE